MPGSPPHWSRRLPFFFGWVVALSLFINNCLSGALQHGNSLFFVALLREFSWNRAETALGLSLAALVYALASPPAGWLLDRFGPRRIIVAGALLTALGLGLSSLIHSRWQFYLFVGLITAIGRVTLAFVINTSVISNWFTRNRGRAMGWVGSGQGFGAFALVPLLAWAIDRFGWRGAFILLGAVVAVVVVPMALAVQYRGPRELGLEPDGDPGEDESPPLEDAATSTGEGNPEARTAGVMPHRPRPRREIVVINSEWAAQVWTLRAALATMQFWAVFVAHFFIGFGYLLIITHNYAHLTDIGVGKIVAASALGASGGMRCLGSFIGGFTVDRWGREVSFTVNFTVTIAGISCLMLTSWWPAYALMMAYALLFGLGSGANSPADGALIADIFQGPHLGVILGALELAIGLGGFCGSWLGGYLFDTAGSYLWPFTIAILALVMACVWVWIAAPRRIRRVRYG